LTRDDALGHAAAVALSFLYRVARSALQLLRLVGAEYLSGQVRLRVDTRE
jgi:hypothetical protein